MSHLSCSECEQRTEYWEMSFDSVVMDSTATGILGELSIFARWTKMVPSVSLSIALYHYATKKTIDSVILLALKQLHSQKFFVRVPINCNDI